MPQKKKNQKPTRIDDIQWSSLSIDKGNSDLEFSGIPDARTAFIEFNHNPAILGHDPEKAFEKSNGVRTFAICSCHQADMLFELCYAGSRKKTEGGRGIMHHDDGQTKNSHIKKAATPSSYVVRSKRKKE